MMGLLRKLVRSRDEIQERLRMLRASVALVAYKLNVHQTRILISGDQNLLVTGTHEQIEAAARRMACRTKSCVVVTVPVSYYHVPKCNEYPPGCLNEEGN